MTGERAEGEGGRILLHLAIRFLTYFVHWMVLAHLPSLLKHAGVSDPGIGLAIGIFALSSMLLMLPLGVFSDLFSPKRTLLACGVLYGGYFLLLPRVASNQEWLLPLMVLGGFGGAGLIVVSESLFLKLHAGENRARRIGFYQMATYLGFGLGPLAGGMILARSPGDLYLASALGALLIAVLSFPLADATVRVFSLVSYGRDLARFAPLLLLACIFVMGTHFGVEQTSLTLFMREVLHCSPHEVGKLFAGLGIWMAFTVIFISAVHDRHRSMFLFFLGGLLVSGIFQIATAFSSSFRELLAVRLLHTLGDAFALLELTVLTAVLFPAHRLGGNSGMLYAVRTLATFGAAVASGTVNQAWGYGASFVINGVFVLLFVTGSLLLVLLHPERRNAFGWKGSGNGN